MIVITNISAEGRRLTGIEAKQEIIRVLNLHQIKAKISWS